MKNTRLRHGSCRGTSTLEFAFVLPMIMLILFAGIELSRAWMTYNLVVSAAREGARVGAVTNPFSSAPAIARINTVLGASRLTAATKTVTCSGACVPDSTVTATVTVNFSTLFPVLLPMLPATIPLTETVIMRYE